ncbi:MAG: class I SAM-dependent methyltransferase [Myxococcales bacterium]|nr:class I SAM-dependent methyltransferase [Myxococcales bacterium]
MSTTLPPHLRSELTKLEAHYAGLVAAHGDGPGAAQWRDRESQDARLRVLAEGVDLAGAKVLDFGCGSGRMLTVLRERFGFDGTYVGVDLVEPALALGRAQHPGARFERRDVLAGELDEDFDVTFVSGVFNHAMPDAWGFVTAALTALFRRTRRTLAFNALSTYVDSFDDGLAYFDPADVFAFCKEHLSPAVALRHDYVVRAGSIPFEMAVHVHRTSATCRPNRAR